jgi:hypothetical protein
MPTNDITISHEHPDIRFSIDVDSETGTEVPVHMAIHEYIFLDYTMHKVRILDFLIRHIIAIRLAKHDGACVLDMVTFEYSQFIWYLYEAEDDTIAVVRQLFGGALWVKRVPYRVFLDESLLFMRAVRKAYAAFDPSFGAHPWWDCMEEEDIQHICPQLSWLITLYRDPDTYDWSWDRQLQHSVLALRR